MDPKALSYANSIKNPATVGEFHSILLSVGLPAPNYTAPLQVKHSTLLRIAVYMMSELHRLYANELTVVFPG